MPHETIAQMSKMLLNLDRWIDEAADTATSNGEDPEALVEAALHADMFPLRRQVQSACDAAKFAAARLSGKELPSHPDEEKTLAELKGRIAATRALLDGFTADDFRDLGKMLDLPMLPDGLVVKDTDYFREFAVPNFYFHVTTAYGILRHKGTPLGKRAFIGHVPLVPKG